MYARLWWKEARLFWPIWLTLGVAALGVQRLILWFDFPRMLIPVSLSWSVLYAFAVGAAAFAGEREANTLAFLDTLPVGRKMLWTSKVSFALATTLVLALVLAALGISGTVGRDAPYAIAPIFGTFVPLLVEALAWTVFWSVVLGAALQSAVLGLATVGLLNLLLNDNVSETTVLAGTIRIGLAGCALWLSLVVFTRGPRPERARRLRATNARAASPFGGLRSCSGRLAWETARESRTIWMLLAAVGFGFPLLPMFGRWHSEAVFWTVLGILAVLLAGVGVFGPASRTRSYRFLAYHGVGPGTVWTTRVVVWVAVMAVFLVPTALMIVQEWRWRPDQRDALWLGFLIVDAFVIGLFCGQVFRRNITAWVVACLALIVLGLPQTGLAQDKLIPLKGLVLFPILVLGVSRAWTGDWMNDLRGAPRWLRLGALMATAGAILVASYIGYRGWSVPDIGRPFVTVAPSIAPVSVSTDQDAAADYEAIFVATRELKPAGRVAHLVTKAVVEGWDPERDPAAGWWEERRGVVEPLRRAAEKPMATFPRAEDPNSIHGRVFRMGPPIFLLGLDSAERRSRGDLAGAWDDLRAAFRITAQISRGGSLAEMSIALESRNQVLQWALAWSSDPRQTPALLRSALADFRALPPLEPFEESIKAEYALIDRTFRGAERDLGLWSQIVLEGGWPPYLRALPWVMLAPSWERERARRVLNLVFADQLELARLEPVGQRLRRPTIPPAELNWYIESTPLAQGFWRRGDAVFQSRHQDLLLGRALEQVLALRIWQLEHGGKYPSSLESLVPDLLPSLPSDPYNGIPFRYRPSEGQKLLPLGWSGLVGTVTGETSRSRPTAPGQWLLYSVGPNQIDNAARTDYETFPASSDLIFPLPVFEANPASPTRD